MLKDKDIREPLFDYLEMHYGRMRILEEKIMGRSRADVLMVLEDGICGIEIKSDADDYSRLASQVKDYDRFWDYNMVVVGASHAGHIEEHVPAHWGILTVEETEEGPDFYELRAPARNPKEVISRKIGILWRPEMNHILEINALPKYAYLSKKAVAAKLLEKLDHELLDHQISECLLERDYEALVAEIEAYRKELAAKEGKKYRRRRKRRKPGLRGK